MSVSRWNGSSLLVVLSAFVDSGGDFASERRFFNADLSLMQATLRGIIVGFGTLKT
jgi:hypothetical protein